LSTGLGLISPLILRTLIDVTLPQKDINQLILLSLGLLILPLISGFISVFMRRTSAQVGEGVIFDLRRSLFANLQRMSLRFFTNTRVGELMSRLNNDVVGAQNAVANTLVGIVTNLVQTVAVLAVMLALDWRLTIASLLIMPFFILAARILGNRLRLIAREQLEAIAQMNAMMNETLNIGGALLVKLFGRKQLEVERFTDRAQQVRDVGVKRAFTGSLFFAAVGLLSALGAAMIYGLGGYFVIQGALGIGTIVAFGSYLNNLYGSLQGLANAPVEFATSMVSFERVFEVIDLPVELGEKPDAVLLQDVQGTLAFEDVSFMYQDGDENLLSEVRRYGSMDQVEAVLSGKRRNGSEKEQDKEEPEAPQSQARGMALEHVSFVAHPGNLVALVGPSGAGKTTLTYLIPRLYDPSEGRITLDGIDLRDVNLDSLSTQIGMVTQETYLFHDTIRTNLQYARLNATQQELEDACRVANIDHFIRELPDGYDTIVGERGYRLSGGEKQRLALARVILKDPRLLVLDEATSSLDSESEALIQDALKQVMAGRTTIAIAHRLSTILAADLILVIDRGQVVERGTHAELLAVNGVYANLYRTQFNKQSESPA
ncbi:MAG: ABC transporter ATP-binding protein, partial [Anaerolineae bacterium]|nr:ABC transporter ATP-binding protein [Anaerolineae bacterium]